MNYNFDRNELKICFSCSPYHFFAKKAKFDIVVRVKAKNEISRSRKQNVSEKILVCFV